MTLIVGLGNPGKEYEGTRHNVGFMVLDKLAVQLNAKFTAAPKLLCDLAKVSQDVFLCKPQTFMNRSGQAVRAVIEYYKLPLQLMATSSDLFVIHDDLDLELGSVKIQLGTGPKVHNGLLSVYEHLGSKNFWHVRVGVDNRGEFRNSYNPSEYVLSQFSKEEQPFIAAAVEHTAEKVLSHF